MSEQTTLSNRSIAKAAFYLVLAVAVTWVICVTRPATAVDLDRANQILKSNEQVKAEYQGLQKRFASLEATIKENTEAREFSFERMAKLEARVSKLERGK